MIRFFGIRHHGAGSALRLRQELEEWGADILLVEGPPEGNELLVWAGDEEMVPPVALLVYRVDQPQLAAYYPYAIFSPEWQALQYGLQAKIPFRFIDLPQKNRLLDEEVEQKERTGGNPLQLFAQAAGFSDYESWWNQLVEEGGEGGSLFAAVFEAMIAIREGLIPPEERGEQLREAYMREQIREAVEEGFEKIAVIVGAFHTPALRLGELMVPSAEEDQRLLAELVEVEVAANWVPWTYGRLAFYSGYGAGIYSPGWYEHLWRMGLAQKDQTSVATEWLVRVARLLRAEDLDASPGELIDAVRLAQSLAGIRGLVSPRLEELNEATVAVLCDGYQNQLELIQKKLIIGEKMGQIPLEMPMLPLQRDLWAEQERLQLQMEPEPTLLMLDLRIPLDLERSHFLSRLLLLGIVWGRKQEKVVQEGTYQEVWQLQWLPDFAVMLVDASLWGNDVRSAAVARTSYRAGEIEQLSQLIRLFDQALLADLPELMEGLLFCLENLAALERDLMEMMEALPDLIRVIRYGSVRQTNQEMVAGLVKQLVTRISVGLLGRSIYLNEEAAALLAERVVGVHSALHTLREQTYLDIWHETLRKGVDLVGIAPLLYGKFCRLLLDDEKMEVDQLMIHLIAVMGEKGAVMTQAYWLEGFLQGAGHFLLYDDQLWGVINGWVFQLEEDQFIQILPLMRRTFATYPKAVRNRLGEKVKSGGRSGLMEEVVLVDHKRAAQIVPTFRWIFGVSDE